MTITVDARDLAVTVSDAILRVAERLEGISETLYSYGKPDYSPYDLES